MHGRTWRLLAAAVLMTATSLVAAWTVPAPRAHGTTLTWNYTADFSSTANPAPDSYGNTGVWSYLYGTAHNPATYSLLPRLVPNACSNSAVDFWDQVSNYPAVAHNHGTTTATCATATIPAGQGFVHPDVGGPAIIGWKSPITGTVGVTGSVVDDDANCSYGDGILWSIDKGATTLASGSFANGGSQAFSAGTGGSSLASQAVSAGDQLYLLVLPNTSFDCDSTGVNLTITQLTGTTITGSYPGNLNVLSGQNIQLSHAQVGGNIKVAPGGQLSIVDSSVGGNVSSDGALGMTICNSTIGGSVTLSGTTGNVLVGDGRVCPGNTIGAQLEIDNTSASVVVGANHIGAKLACSGNSSVSNNGAPNTALKKTGQCTAL